MTPDASTASAVLYLAVAGPVLAYLLVLSAVAAVSLWRDGRGQR
jgi:hypothetical protein